MTYAEPPGSCEARKSAVASAEVQIAASGTSRPLRESRAARSRGVKIELLVNTRKRRWRSTRRARKSAAPGRALPSCTSTPSMSVSQHWDSVRSVVTRCSPRGRPGRCSGPPSAASGSLPRRERVEAPTLVLPPAARVRLPGGQRLVQVHGEETGGRLLGAERLTPRLAAGSGGVTEEPHQLGLGQVQPGGPAGPLDLDDAVGGRQR